MATETIIAESENHRTAWAYYRIRNNEIRFLVNECGLSISFVASVYGTSYRQTRKIANYVAKVA